MEKRKPSFLLILVNVTTEKILALFLAVVSAGLGFEQWKKGVSMIYTWFWWVFAVFLLVLIFSGAVREYQKELESYNSQSKPLEKSGSRYEKSPHTEGNHIGDIIYGDKLVNAQKENLALAKSKTEKVKAHIVFEEFPQNMSAIPYLSLKLYNHEQDEIEKCYGTLLELENLYTPTVTIPILEIVNPNSKFLSWGGGSPTEQVTLPRSDGVHPGVKVLNIAKGAADVVFLFHGHESNYHGMNFRAKIKIDGELNGTPIESIVTEFCFKYGVNHYTTRQREPEIGEKQRVTIVVTDIKSRFAFEDCDKIWKTSVIDIENE